MRGKGEWGEMEVGEGWGGSGRDKGEVRVKGEVREGEGIP